MTSRRASVETDAGSENRGDWDCRMMPLANSEMPPTVLPSSLKLPVTTLGRWMLVSTKAMAKSGASTTGWVKAWRSDIVANAYKYFVVATPEDFRDLQLAAAASPPGAPHPTKLEEFMQAHPSVARANAALATPDSFADEQYYGVDAFIFTNKLGQKHLLPSRIWRLIS